MGHHGANRKYAQAARLAALAGWAIALGACGGTEPAETARYEAAPTVPGPVEPAQAPPKTEEEGVRAERQAQADPNTMVDPVEPGIPRPLSAADRAALEANDWRSFVGDDEMFIWVSVKDQRLRVVENGRIVMELPCSTAEKGIGSEMNSFKTPPGWHRIHRKTGGGQPKYTVFRGGGSTGKTWAPGSDVDEDLVLTRILFLDGLEEGKNSGGNVDSEARKIYIHGTNQEEEPYLGEVPSSHGCVRLSNDDVMTLYERVEGRETRVLIDPSGAEDAL